jgi:hypothetical protein
MQMCILHFGMFLLLLVAMGKSLDIENARLSHFLEIETTRHDTTKTTANKKDDDVQRALIK